MADLFEAAGLTPQAPSPLADRLRPQRLDEVVGQDHLLGPEDPIRRMADAKRLASRARLPCCSLMRSTASTAPSRMAFCCSWRRGSSPWWAPPRRTRPLS